MPLFFDPGKGLGAWVEVADFSALVARIAESVPEAEVAADKVMVAPYSSAGRHIVVLRNYGVVGFTDGPLKIEEAAGS